MGTKHTCSIISAHDTDIEAANSEARLSLSLSEKNSTSSTHG